MYGNFSVWPIKRAVSFRASAEAPHLRAEEEDKPEPFRCVVGRLRLVSCEWLVTVWRRLASPAVQGGWSHTLCCGVTWSLSLAAGSCVPSSSRSPPEMPTLLSTLPISGVSCSSVSMGSDSGLTYTFFSFFSFVLCFGFISRQSSFHQRCRCPWATVRCPGCSPVVRPGCRPVPIRPRASRWRCQCPWRR